MLRSVRAMLCAGACVAGVALTPAAASALPIIDHFALDSYHAGKKSFTPPAVSAVKLNGGLYVAVVQGTFSYYSAINYQVPQSPWTIVCGTPLPAPEFGSAGGSGEVGFDSEFIFARPWLPAPCAHAKLPVKWVNFQMNPGTGIWTHPSVLTSAPLTAPTAGHTYEYALASRKAHHVAFRLYDIGTRDNYGSLRISLRHAVPSDCAGGKYAAYGQASEAVCVAAINPPAKGKGK